MIITYDSFKNLSEGVLDYYSFDRIKDFPVCFQQMRFLDRENSGFIPVCFQQMRFLDRENSSLYPVCFRQMGLLDRENSSF